MANSEHLARLLQGHMAWNAWRQQSPEVTVDLSSVSLIGADLQGYCLDWAILRDTDLTRASLRDSSLAHAYCRGAIFRDADLRQVTACHADFENTDCSNADLALSDWRETRFDSSILRNARCSFTNFAFATMRSADLSDADFTFAQFEWTDMRGTRVTNTLIGSTKFNNVDLGNVLDLESMRYSGASSIGIDTFFRSGGLPESFLRGCGAPETFAAFAWLALEPPGTYPSCFISYSTADELFACRLRAGLEANSVNTWFAPDDLKIGDRFRSRIDTSIREQDRLVLILSVKSIESDWVESEVEAAFERERRERKVVLVPVRVDDAIFSTSKAWAAEVRRTRHIGNFSHWTQQEEYERSFARLLRDLKVSTS